MAKVGAMAVPLAFLVCIATSGMAQQAIPPTQPEQQAQPQNPGTSEKSGNRLLEGRDMLEGGGRMYGGRLGNMAHPQMGEWGSMHHGGMGHNPSMMSPVLLRMIFTLMDSDGDGTVSLQEWQAAQEKIFRAMDVDKDGTITFEEMMNFLRGRARAPVGQNQSR